jgi:hypothetical protein
MNEPLLDRRERAAAPSGAPVFALWNLGFACFICWRAWYAGLGR